MRNIIVVVFAGLIACDSPGASEGTIDANKACHEAWGLVCSNDAECNTLTPDNTFCDGGFVDVDALCADRASAVDWDGCETVVTNSVCPRDEPDEVNGFNAAVIRTCQAQR